MQISKVIDISHKGLGVIQHSDGRKLFVEGVVPGDEIEYQITELKKRFGFAKLVKLVRPSSYRVESACKFQGFKAGTCGGCPWMIMDIDYQLKLKNQLVKTQIERSNLPVVTLNPIQSSPKSFHYRNRAQLKTDGNSLGFVSRGRKSLAVIDECLVLNQKCNNLIQKISECLPKSEWKPQGKFKWNFIEIDDELDFSQLAINTKTAFRQANSAQNQFMKNWLTESLKAFSNKTPILELFSGNGNFTECFKDFFDVAAYEYSNSAIEQLKNKLPQVRAESINLFERKNLKKIIQNHQNTELLVLDPPREGFSELNFLIQNLNHLKQVIYISCDPSSWSNDLMALDYSQWQIKTVQPLDQFPHTPHVELISVISRL